MDKLCPFCHNPVLSADQMCHTCKQRVEPYRGDAPQIERAAQALWKASRSGRSTMDTWEQLREELKDHWREMAVTAITAYYTGETP